MEELLALAILSREDIVPSEEYEKKLDGMFLSLSLNDDIYDMLLNLEYESLETAASYIISNMNYNAFNDKIFGKILMERLKLYYEENFYRIDTAAYKMFVIWESLPWNLQDKEPFASLNHVGDPLSYKDETMARNICDRLLNYYEGKI